MSQAMMGRGRMPGGMRGARRALAVALIGAGVVAACASETAAPEPRSSVYVIPITGVIELGLAPFVLRSLREATAAGAEAAVLELNTPGGRVDAAQHIVDHVQGAEIPVLAYVNPQAFSAGAMIALAADEIYMRPGAVMGTATPVTGEGDKAPEKIVSAMRSEMRGLAERRDLDPRIAEAMVDESIAVEGVVERGNLAGSAIAGVLAGMVSAAMGRSLLPPTCWPSWCWPWASPRAAARPLRGSPPGTPSSSPCWAP